MGEARTPENEGYGCPDCGLYSCVCFDDEEIGSPDEDDFDNCGMGPDGFCSLAGTEHCDWDCKVSRRFYEESLP